MDYICNLTIVSILQQFVALGRMITEGQLVTHTHTHTHTHIYIYIYIHTHTHTHTHVQM